MPPKAELFLDPQSLRYASPICKQDDPVLYATFVRRITNGMVDARWDSANADGSIRAFQPDPKCRDRKFWSRGGLSGGFTESRLPFQKPTRWNSDGSWRW
jgi:hypothetical protein